MKLDPGLGPTGAEMGPDRGTDDGTVKADMQCSMSLTAGRKRAGPFRSVPPSEISLSYQKYQALTGRIIGGWPVLSRKSTRSSRAMLVVAVFSSG